jgi:hypothetical protein
MRLLAGVIAAITVMLLAGWAEATNLTRAAGRPPARHASLIERERASDLVVLARGDGIRSAPGVLLVRALRRPVAPLALKLKVGPHSP